MGRFSWLEVSSVWKHKSETAREVPELGEGHYLELAETRLREGSYETALRYYSRVLSRDIKVEKAWLGQLLCLLNLGEYKEAITWADKALEIFPGSADMVAAKALAWGRSGNVDKALAFSDASLKLNSGSSFVWWARGDLIMANNVRTADHCFAKATEIDKDDWILMLRVAQTYLSYDRPTDARKYLLRARQLAADNPMVWHYLGVTYRELGMAEDALKAFRRALELNPHSQDSSQALEALEKAGLREKFRLFMKRWRTK